MKTKRLLLVPHLDDGAVSLGGTLLADRTKHPNEIEDLVATVFSRSNFTKEGLGDEAVVTPIRQSEEQAVMRFVGAEALFLDFPECPLRGYTISDPLDYPKKIRAELDEGIVEKLASRIEELFREFGEVLLPLAIGNDAHVDHRIVRLAGSLAWQNNPDLRVGLYEDVPYIEEETRNRVSGLEGLEAKESPIDLQAKLELVRGYVSQPIESWEGLIRQAAGQPPVERTWLVGEPTCLGQLEQ
jgi:LmbE family N-acetylglucosaminyl deacetylase